jgi:hypothetical protein
MNKGAVGKPTEFSQWKSKEVTASRSAVKFTATYALVLEHAKATEASFDVSVMMAIQDIITQCRKM